MAVIQLRSNDALNNNPPAGDEHLSVHGSDWLWAVFAVYLASFLAVFALSFAARAGERVFHYVYSIGLFVGVVTYFAMASDLGFVVVRTINQESRGLSRQVFFAHYINWVVAFPAAILSLGLVSGLPWATIVYQIFLSWIWVISYLVGAFTTSNYKWGFYAFGTFAWILLAVSQWLLDGRRSAVRVGVARDFNLLSGWLNLLWLLYPLAYGLSDGGNRIGVTPSFIWYGILDALLLPVLAFGTLVLSRNWDYSGLNIAFTQYGRVPVAGGHFPEKEQAAAAAPATATPAGGPGGPGVVAPEPAVTA